MTWSAVLVDIFSGGHLGVGHVASYARERGFRVGIEVVTAANPSSVARRILASKTPVVGYSVQEPSQIEGGRRFLRLLRRSGYKGLIVLGGALTSVLGVEILRLMAEADVVIAGEGEEPFVGLLRAEAAGRDREAVPGVLRWGALQAEEPAGVGEGCGIEELARPLRPTDHSGRRRSWGDSAALLYGRGCSHSCPGCGVASVFGARMERGVWRRSPFGVASEMESLVNTARVRHFSFVDHCLLRPGEGEGGELRRLGESIDQRRLPASFDVTARADGVDPGVVEVLARAGLAGVTIGPEPAITGSVRGHCESSGGGGLGEALEILSGNEISVRLIAAVADPRCTLEQVRANLQELRSLVALYPVRLRLAVTRPYHGTAEHKELVRVGIVSADPLDDSLVYRDDRVRRFVEMVSLLQIAPGSPGDIADQELEVRRARVLRGWTGMEERGRLESVGALLGETLLSGAWQACEHVSRTAGDEPLPAALTGSQDEGADRALGAQLGELLMTTWRRALEGDEAE